jgi:hypothetical protein
MPSKKLFNKTDEKMSKEEYFKKDSVPKLIRKLIDEDYKKKKRIAVLNKP